MPHQTVVIRLELHPDDGSVSGRASVGSGAAREFVGWMGLVAAIDALVGGLGTKGSERECTHEPSS